jgi:hypothetical protein
METSFLPRTSWLSRIVCTQCKTLTSQPHISSLSHTYLVGKYPPSNNLSSLNSSLVWPLCSVSPYTLSLHQSVMSLNTRMQISCNEFNKSNLALLSLDTLWSQDSWLFSLTSSTSLCLHKTLLSVSECLEESFLSLTTLTL